MADLIGDLAVKCWSVSTPMVRWKSSDKEKSERLKNKCLTKHKRHVQYEPNLKRWHDATWVIVNRDAGAAGLPVMENQLDNL